MKDNPTKRILLFGAGRSATHLINYLLDRATTYNWHLTIADANLELANKKLAGRPGGSVQAVDIHDESLRRELIVDHELVISLLPAHLHQLVAEDCFYIGRNLCTASYVTEEMEHLAARARAKGLVFMGELGLDPGLDHMSALECIDDLQDKGAELLSFKSYTGGLVAPESDTNPWHYKISWNPRNVVLAGKGTATYMQHGLLKYIPYHKLFRRYEVVDIKGLGEYDMYANRDSLSYRHIYGIDGIQTIIRGTLRHVGYCDAWHALVYLGLTNDDVEVANPSDLTYSELLQAHIPFGLGRLEKRVADYLDVSEHSDVIAKLDYLGLFSDEKIPVQHGTSAQILEDLIKRKWKLNPEDKDLIIMQHEFEYRLEGEHKLTSTLIVKGDDAVNTAMSKLVGLPLAIFAKMVINGDINEVATCRPTEQHVYLPILEELKEFDVAFQHYHE